MDAETTKLVERLNQLAIRITVGANEACEEAATLIERQAAEIERLREALERLRDCDFVISLPDRMDAVRDIARDALDNRSRADG